MHGGHKFYSLIFVGDYDVGRDIKDRGSNELYEHRMQTNGVESLTAELREPHEFITEGLTCLGNTKKFKVGFFFSNDMHINLARFCLSIEKLVRGCRVHYLCEPELVKG